MLYPHIGPDCYLNMNDFVHELKYIEKNDFDTSLVKVFPNITLLLLNTKKKMLKNIKPTRKHR